MLFAFEGEPFHGTSPLAECLMRYPFRLQAQLFATARILNDR